METESSASRLPLRAAAIVVAGAGTLFWLYTFYAIAQVPVGDGTGFQWVAVMPLGAIFFALTFPALLLSLRGRRLWLALVLGCAGLVAFALMWNQLLSEFYEWAYVVLPANRYEWWALQGLNL